MDNLLDSVTRKGRKLKERLRGKKDKRDKSGVNTAEESIDSSSSFLRPIATGGHDGKGSGTSTDARQVHSGDRSPQPESVPAEGREDDGEEREADADEKEASQGHSCPEPNVETVVGGGPCLTSVGPPSSSPPTPILLGGKSDSGWTC